MRTLLEHWPPAPTLRTERLQLEPLRVAHAAEMAALLDDPRLHVFTGGAPRTPEELRHRYEQQVRTWSLDVRRRWVNWIVRDLAGARAVGGVQAVVTVEDDVNTAELSWILGSRHQGHGYAREAATAMIGWLRRQGAQALFAEIHPENAPSMALARRLGLTPTATVGERGDVRWSG